MNAAVERAIKFICDKYGEPLSLADVADSAILSRFHFSRLFRDTTGVTPGRFLSAVRIYQAKRMLMTTGMKVTDIAYAVGYNSLGSFGNHFSASVCVSPGRFRRIMRDGGFDPSALRHGKSGGTVTGELHFPPGFSLARCFVGAFDSPIVQRRPAAAVMVEARPADETASYVLSGVPRGTWFVHAVAVADSADPEPWTRRALLSGGAGEVEVAADGEARVPIHVRPRRPTDLPILLALPGLDIESESLDWSSNPFGGRLMTQDGGVPDCVTTS
jgi:AraC-like DNA-binding protein